MNDPRRQLWVRVYADEFQHQRANSVVPGDAANCASACATTALSRFDSDFEDNAATLAILLDFVKLVASEDCLRSLTEFRGSCGRDGKPLSAWCAVCQAKGVLSQIGGSR